MQCLNCGKDYPDGASFCPDCGAANPGNVNQANPNGGFQNQGFQNQGFQNQGFQNQAYQSQGNPNGGFKAPIKNRSIALCIILTIVTCGIYGIVWIINVADDLNMASGYDGDTSGGMVFLLTLITCGIYGLYWYYKCGEKVSVIRQRQGLPESGSNGILYLVLSLFGLSIISLCLIQSELNNVASI